MAESESKRQTYYVVQAFTRAGEGYQMDEPIEVRSETAAIRTAERLVGTRAIVLAFARTGDPNTGEFDDAVIIYNKGEIPEELAEVFCA
ncbi:hypothetical protein ACQVP2_22485 [Methylobacterium aquaticum]|uniref:hypothetical protein n=1 Tax=Methylobacterium aquaticum TaxID=270351 RepID=UPI003D17D7B9